MSQSYFTFEEMKEIDKIRDSLGGCYRWNRFWDNLYKAIQEDSSELSKAVVMAGEFHDDLRWGFSFFLPTIKDIMRADKDLRDGKPQLIRVTGNLVSSEIGDGSYEYAIDIDRARRAIQGSEDPEDVRHLRLLGNLFPSI